jgi:hypothetical protein
MNVMSIREQLEAEITWRQDEIRFFRNQMSNLSEEERDQFRKALILMLYAHFEGFFKFSMLSYIKSINDEKICCSEASYSVAAASFQEIFKDLFNIDKKSKIFKKKLPDDTKLHRAARQIDFVSKFDELQTQKVIIPEDLVDTSNLQPFVLKKCLFILGFQHNAFEDQDHVIVELLERRNSIAHGASRSGIKEDQYKKLENSVFEMMESVMMFVVDSLKNKSYLKEVMPS